MWGRQRFTTPDDIFILCMRLISNYKKLIEEILFVTVRKHPRITPFYSVLDGTRGVEVNTIFTT